MIQRFDCVVALIVRQIHWALEKQLDKRKLPADWDSVFAALFTI
jgi:hypothetical protein